MKLLLVLCVLHLLFGVDASLFKKHKDYVKRVRCMYGFSKKSSTPVESPKHLENVTLLYYQLDGKNDSVRYIWSFVGSPTLLISVLPVEDRENCSESVSNLIRNYYEFVDKQSFGSVDIPEIYESDYTLSVVFNQLIEFKDTSYKAEKSFNSSDLNNNETYRGFGLSGLNWNWTYDSSSGAMSLVARDQNYNSSSKAKQFAWNIKLYVPTKPGRVGSFPKTLYSENATVFDFVFSDFNYTISNGSDPNIKYGRLVLETQLVHGNLSNNSISQKFSRDDEYTPSVFLTNNKLFGQVDVDEQVGFLQWKPISYLSHKRKSTQSQQANNAPIISGTLFSQLSPGLVTAVYPNDSAAPAGIIQTMYIVFGTEGDDNNANPTYVSWTGMLGFGVPPEDSISIIVIITIIVGLGVPALLIGLGGVFLVIRRKPWKKLMDHSKKNGYTKLDINDNSK